MLTYLITVTFLTSTLSGMIGMAGGVILLSAMTFFLPIELIIPIHGMIQLVANISRTFLLRKSVAKKLLIPMILGLPIGAVVAVLILKEINIRHIAYPAIITLILYSVFKPKKLPQLKIKDYQFFFVGMITGVLSILAGSIGPFLAPFLLRDDLSKEEIVATKSSMQVFSHIMKIPAFIYLGINYANYSVELISSSIAAILGTYIGVNLLKRINDRKFKLLFKSFLLIAAIRLIFKYLDM